MRVSNSRWNVLCGTFVTATLLLLAAFLVAPTFSQAKDRWFSISTNPDFADVRAQLQVAVNEHAHQKTSVFCIVGERTKELTEAWVYWPGEDKLILWLPDGDNPHALVGSKRYLDLRRDVIDGPDVHGSTYQLTRATADEKIRACKRHGTSYTIKKSASEDTHG